jgi:hypothetical protein
MAITPPTYAPSGSIFGTTAKTTPYTYGAIAPTTSSYNIWGSKGNPYITAGPTYTPGAGAPIVPRTVATTPRVIQPGDSGGDGYPGDDGSPSPGGYDGEVGGATYGDWYSGRDAMDRAMNPSWGQLIPGVGALSAIDSAFAGVNPTPFGDRIWDNYTGPGMAASNQFGLNKGEQRDMIIGQEYDFWDNPYEEQQWRNESRSPERNEYSNLLSNFKQGKELGLVPATKLWGEYYNENKSAPAPAAPVDKSWDNKSFSAPTINTNNMPQSFSQYADPGLVAESNARISEQNNAIAQAQEARSSGTGGEVGGVTYSDGSSSSSLSDMAAGTSGSYSSANSGDVGVTSYGDGQYGFDDNGTEVGWEDPGGESGGSDDSGGGGSYIATAATQSLGTAGLTVFNNWRDYMHTWHPTFTTSFGRYRVTAPEIVKVIDSKNNSKELYKEIWEEHLKPIYDLIVNKDDDKALIKYKVMVKELMNRYLKGDT